MASSQLSAAAPSFTPGASQATHEHSGTSQQGGPLYPGWMRRGGPQVLPQGTPQPQRPQHEQDGHGGEPPHTAGHDRHEPHQHGPRGQQQQQQQRYAGDGAHRGGGRGGGRGRGRGHVNGPGAAAGDGSSAGGRGGPQSAPDSADHGYEQQQGQAPPYAHGKGRGVSGQRAPLFAPPQQQYPAEAAGDGAAAPAPRGREGREGRSGRGAGRQPSQQQQQQLHWDDAVAAGMDTSVASTSGSHNYQQPPPTQDAHQYGRGRGAGGRRGAGRGRGQHSWQQQQRWAVGGDAPAGQAGPPGGPGPEQGAALGPASAYQDGGPRSRGPTAGGEAQQQQRAGGGRPPGRASQQQHWRAAESLAGQQAPPDAAAADGAAAAASRSGGAGGSTGRRGANGTAAAGRLAEGDVAAAGAAVAAALTLSMGGGGSRPAGAAPAPAGGAGGAASASGSDSDTGEDEADAETLTCVVCCEQVIAVAVAGCGHSHTCARCTLTLRLCYGDKRCPLCKAVNREVVVTRAPPPGSDPPHFEELIRQRDRLWQRPRWAAGVLVDDAGVTQPGGGAAPRRGVRPLHSVLMGMTSRACCRCDAGGRRPFPTLKLLQDHLRCAHSGLQLCDICLNAGRRFPLEQPALDPPSLEQHVADAHPLCEFCALRFYSNDELWSHMHDRHFTCYLCQRAGRQHLYFKDAQALMAHMRSEHHLCDHPDCEGCMQAFDSPEELAMHIRDMHSGHMPRWDRNRARRMDLDFLPSRGGGPAAGAAADAGRRGGSASRRQANSPAGAGRPGAADPSDPSLWPSLESAVGSTAAAGQGAAQAAGQGGAAGYDVIDDDMGMLEGDGGGRPGHAAGSRAAGQGGGGGAGGAAAAVAQGGAGQGGQRLLAGAWAGRVPGTGTFGEEFPSLASGPAAPAAPSGGASASSSSGGRWAAAAATQAALPSAGGGGSARASLIKVSARCACGRKVEHLALRPDQPVPTLQCDASCEAAGRRTQLAGAFGRAEGDAPYFDRHRAVTYPPALLQAALSCGLDWVGGIERELAALLADPTRKVATLPGGMSAQQRKLVHELAGAYGLISRSNGDGVKRAVQLLKGPAAGVPTRLLSAAALAADPADLLRQLAAGGPAGAPGKHVLRLIDVAPGANLEHHLRSWEGEYTLTRSRDGSSATVAFAREAPFKDCLATLAGGVRGAFRVERNTAPQQQQGPQQHLAAPAAPGWQVLQAPAQRRAAAAAPRTPAVTAAASSAWDSDEERDAKVRALAASRAAAAAGGGGAAPQPHLARLGPAPRLAQPTVWSELPDELEA